MPLRLLAEILAPDECLDCGREGALWCRECVDGYRAAASGSALRHLDGITAAALFDGTVKEVIHALKYERRQSGARPLAQLIARALPQRSFDTVAAVPTPPGRLRRRGYSQAELIARELAAELGLPFLPLLARVNSDSQVGAGRSQRLDRVRGTFLSARRAGGHILLVDDVMTTGATLAECAKVLKAAGAASVWGAVAARD